MALDDTIENAAQQAAGRPEEVAGEATDDEQLEAERRGDRAAAQVKKVGEDVVS